MTLSSSVSSIASAASSAWPNLAAWIMRPSSSWSVLTVNYKQKESTHHYLKCSIFLLRWHWKKVQRNPILQFTLVCQTLLFCTLTNLYVLTMCSSRKYPNFPYPYFPHRRCFLWDFPCPTPWPPSGDSTYTLNISLHFVVLQNHPTCRKFQSLLWVA